MSGSRDAIDPWLLLSNVLTATLETSGYRTKLTECFKTGVKVQLTKGKEKEIKLQVKSWHSVSLEAMIFTTHSTGFYIDLQKQSLLTNGVSNA